MHTQTLKIKGSIVAAVSAGTLDFLV